MLTSPAERNFQLLKITRARQRAPSRQPFGRPCMVRGVATPNLGAWRDYRDGCFFGKGTTISGFQDHLLLCAWFRLEISKLVPGVFAWPWMALKEKRSSSTNAKSTEKSPSSIKSTFTAPDVSVKVLVPAYTSKKRQPQEKDTPPRKVI